MRPEAAIDRLFRAFGIGESGETRSSEAKRGPMDLRRAGRGTRWFDLFVVVDVALIALNLAYLANPRLAFFRIGFGFLAVLFAPGYVTLAAVTAGRRTDEELGRWDWIGTELGRWERLVLCVPVSIAIVVLLGVFVNFTPLGVRPATMVLVVTGYTVSIAAVAVIRRVVSEAGTASAPLGDIVPSIGRLRDPPTEVDLVLNLLVLLIIVAGAVAVVAPLSGQSTPSFTEFALSGGNESGDLDTEDYLFENGSNGSATVVARIANRERRSVQYTVVVQLQRATVGKRSVAVIDRRRASTTTVGLDGGERARIGYDFGLPETPSGCRVAFLLYRGEVPPSPTVENAYRELHLWHTPDPPPNRTRCPSLSAIDVETNRPAVTAPENASSARRSRSSDGRSFGRSLR